MSITSVIRTRIKTTNFYDIATQVKEQQVSRCLYDGEDCSVQTLLHYVNYSTVRTTVGTKTFNQCKGILVIDKNTGKQKSFDNSSDFDSWKRTVSVSELMDCIIEIYFAESNGEGTEQYYFEPSNMDRSSNKRIKLYNFEVLDRDTEQLIPEVSFEETNCSRGLDKIEGAIKKATSGLSPNNCIVMLNGIDITEFFTDPDAVNIKYYKKETRGESYFRYIHIGLKERIVTLLQSRALLEALLKDDPIAQKKTLAEIDKEIKDLKNQLKASRK